MKKVITFIFIFFLTISLFGFNTLDNKQYNELLKEEVSFMESFSFTCRIVQYIPGADTFMAETLKHDKYKFHKNYILIFPMNHFIHDELRDKINIKSIVLFENILFDRTLEVNTLIGNKDLRPLFVFTDESDITIITDIDHKY